MNLRYSTTKHLRLFLFMGGLFWIPCSANMVICNAPKAVAGGDGSNFTDTFTEATTVELDTHNEGYAWSDISSGNNLYVSSAAGNAYPTGTSNVTYRLGYTFADADYCWQMQVRTGSASAFSLSLAWRVNASNEGYFVYWEGTSNYWQFYRYESGGPTPLGTYAGDSPNGTTRTVRVCTSGSTNTTTDIYIDGVKRFNAVADTTGLSAAGSVGINTYGISATTTTYVDTAKVFETVAAP